MHYTRVIVTHFVISHGVAAVFLEIVLVAWNKMRFQQN